MMCGGSSRRAQMCREDPGIRLPRQPVVNCELVHITRGEENHALLVDRGAALERLPGSPSASTTSCDATPHGKARACFDRERDLQLLYSSRWRVGGAHVDDQSVLVWLGSFAQAQCGEDQLDRHLRIAREDGVRICCTRHDRNVQPPAP
eukprot:6307228-Prymnesium_polylepis.3